MKLRDVFIDELGGMGYFFLELEILNFLMGGIFESFLLRKNCYI